MISLQKQLKKFASLERKKINERFFKTGKGEYGEGDIFMGVRVPDIRKAVRENREISLGDLSKEIASPIHEVRLCAVLILVEKNRRAIKEGNKKEQKSIVDFYLRYRKHINNWDIVDASSHYILGQAVLDKVMERKILFQLAKSKKLWERRIAVIASWAFIKNDDTQLTLEIAEMLLHDREDLIHKAIGWMLREAWKRDAQKVEDFLRVHSQNLPRTTLRYAIERMDERKRRRYLKLQSTHR